MPDDTAGNSSSLSSGSRALSAAEACLAAIAVIGHNVFHRIPNEVPILVVLAIISLRVRQGRWNWGALGFKRPDSWRRLLVIALCAAALRILIGDFIVEPVAAHFWPSIKPPSGVDEIHGHVSTLLIYLAVVWIFAGLGEEIGYRGYILNKLSDVFGRNRLGDIVAILGSAVLFGFGHYYKGPAGIVDSGIAGGILGVLYLISGRNLWACVIAHGSIDTFGLFADYFGLAN